MLSSGPTAPMYVMNFLVSFIHQRSYLILMVLAMITACLIYMHTRAKRAVEKVASRGRVAVISGGGAGISEHIARELLQRGFIVFSGEFDKALRSRSRARLRSEGSAHDTRDDDLTRPVRNEAGVYAHYLDVRSDNSVDEFHTFVRSALRVLGKPAAVHVLVNNATVYNACPLEHLDRRTMLDTLNVQICGGIAVTQRFLPHLIMASRQSSWKSRIINMCSGAAVLPAPVYGAYSIAKSGVSAMCDILRQELRQRGCGEGVHDGAGVVCVCKVEFGMCDTAAAREFVTTIQRRMSMLFPDDSQSRDDDSDGDGRFSDALPNGMNGADEDGDADAIKVATGTSDSRRVKLPAGGNPYREVRNRLLCWWLSLADYVSAILGLRCILGLHDPPTLLQLAASLLACRLCVRRWGMCARVFGKLIAGTIGFHNSQVNSGLCPKRVASEIVSRVCSAHVFQPSASLRIGSAIVLAVILRKFFPSCIRDRLLHGLHQRYRNCQPKEPSEIAAAKAWRISYGQRFQIIAVLCVGLIFANFWLFSVDQK